MIDAGECDECMEIVYEVDNEVVITKRRYKKIPALLGEFGGMLKLLTSTFVVLSFYYSGAIKSFLFSQVFGIEKSKAEQILKRAGRSLDIVSGENQGTHLKKPRDQGRGPGDKGEASFLRKNNYLRNSNPSLKRFRKEVVNSKTDIVGLTKTMNLVDVLDGANLNNYHEVLLPLVVLRVNQSSGQDPVTTQQKINKNLNKIYPENKNRDREPEVKGGGVTASQPPESRHEGLSEDQKYYALLKQMKPQNSLEDILNKRILFYLSLAYEQK